MQLASLADPSLVFPQLAATDIGSVLRAFAERIAEKEPGIGDPEQLYRALWEREQLGSTGLGGGVAVPHCKLDGLDRVLLAVGHTRQPVDFGAIDNEPVQLFFVVVSPSSEPAAHLQCLAAISRWVQQTGGVEPLLHLGEARELYEALGDRSSP